MTSSDPRDRALHEAAVALNSELSLDALLQKLVETAAELTGARYAALGVIDPTGAALERFVTTGVDEETHRAIGDLPRGRGILGVLIHDAVPLRLHHISDDARSVGFPPNHPPMGTFLGVPVLLRGVAYGNLYLTEKEGGGDFTDEDQADVILLATHAAVAIENARLYESATSWSRQLESVNEIAAALAQEVDLAPLLQLVAERLRELIDARAVAVALPQGDGSVRVEASAGLELVGEVLDATSKTARVLERRRSERIDSVLDDPEVNVEFARRFQHRAALWVPLLVADRAIGILFALDKNGPDPRFTDEDLRLAESLSRRAAVAVDRSERVARDSLRRVVEAQEQERRRLALELHDETGQALTSILLGLRGIEPGESPQLQSLRELVVDTLRNVRRLAVELRPSALDDFGLEPALARLVAGFSERTTIRVDLTARLGEERLPRDVETAFYRIVQESLTNVARHAGASRVDVLLGRTPGSATLLVEDDGSGFDPEEAPRSSLGLVGMRERVGLLQGRFRIESRPGTGTTIAVEVPL
ncbi:MAG TPA: GAF domain-containing sensor histidine kinase [Gaiellaceae bacterium]|nr:GAF domain-containing sensor histidine kinase [Gaiellaceae bacterium]